MAIATGIVGVFAVVLAIGVLISTLLRPKVDPREPPVFHPKVPLIGHIIGMLQEGPLYLKRISTKCKAPIFTLPMFTGRTYVVTSPAIASLVQRASSTLDFDELIVQTTPRMTGLNAETKRLLEDKTAKSEGRIRMVARSHDVINPPLRLGEMEGIAAVQLRHFSDFINKIQDGFETELFHFVTREITAASMYTFYGPENPFALYPELIQAFWDWEAGIVAYMTGVFPKLTCPKAYYGMEKCVKGFIEYLEKGRHKDAYKLIRNRKQLHDDHHISIPEQARLEMGIAFAFNGNASITIFWVLNNIFSQPALLAEIREEIRANALVGESTLSWTALRDKCPLLHSVYRESLRLIAPLTSARYVLDDTIIADTYLLRKDTVVQIAGGVIHSDTSIWGPDASSFNARRFLFTPNGTKSGPDGNITDSKSNQVHAAAFRGFGGGTTLCPGRHFAQMEIMSLTAVLVSGYDMLPPSGSKNVEWNPPRDDKRFPFAVTKPLRRLDVRLQKREGMKDKNWELKI